MDKYLVYYGYYHTQGLEKVPELENSDVKIACVYADNYQDADVNCYNSLNLENTGYVIHVVKL